MKKLFGMILVLALLCCGAMAADAPEEFTSGDYSYTINADGSATITDFNTEYDGELIIPEELDGKRITGIGWRAFEDCEDLTAITIPESVISIGENAFDKCPDLLLTVTRDSYAAQYVRENGLEYAYTDALDWLYA